MQKNSFGPDTATTIENASITGIIVFFVYASLRLLFKRVKECFRFCSHKSVNNESEVDKGEKDNIKFIIAGENAAKAFDTPKQPLDLIALLVQLLIIAPGIFPVLLRWNNRHIPKRQSQGSRFVTFLSPIHQPMNWTGNRTEPP